MRFKSLAIISFVALFSGCSRNYSVSISTEFNEITLKPPESIKDYPLIDKDLEVDFKVLNKTLWIKRFTYRDCPPSSNWESNHKSVNITEMICLATNPPRDITLLPFQKFKGKIPISISRKLEGNEIEFQLKFVPYIYKEKEKYLSSSWSNILKIQIKKQGAV